jgi:glycosyltransferase involved in cell wall biosynthesis
MSWALVALVASRPARTDDPRRFLAGNLAFWRLFRFGSGVGDKLVGAEIGVDIRVSRILFVGHSPLQGGAELCLDTTLRHLERVDRVIRAVLPWEGPMAQSARDLGIPVSIVPLSWWSHWPPSAWYYKTLLLSVVPNVCRLLALIRRHRIDLVYTNTSCIFESAIAAALAGVPHVWHVHEVVQPGRGQSSRVLPVWLTKKLVYRLSDRILFESQSARRAFEEGKSSPRSRVVYNSVRFPDLPEGGSTDGRKDRLGFGPDDLVIGCVGQLIDRKNPALLVRAMARLRHLPNVKAVFVGSGPLRDEMSALINQLGLNNRCRLLGFQDDVRWVMNAIDILVLPSRQESFGLVLVEAGAFGKPVIATRVEGPSEIVADGETGFLIGNDDEADLAAKLETLCRDSAKRRQMGEAGRLRVGQLFSAPENTRRIEGVIDEVLAERAPNRAASAARS